MTNKASYGMTSSVDLDREKDSEKQSNGDGSIVTGHVTFSLILAVTGAVLGSFQFGYGLGVTNNPEKSIKDFMNQTEVDRSGTGLSSDTIKNLWSLAVSIYAVGGCFGGFFGGWVAKTLGRKNGSLYNALYGIVCSALLFASRRAATYELFIIGRFMIGIHSGIYSAITPLFLSEISPTHIRGAVGVLHQLAVVTGLLAAQVLGFHVILGGSQLWDVLLARVVGREAPTLDHMIIYLPMFAWVYGPIVMSFLLLVTILSYFFAFSALPCVGQLLILPFCPASPRFLMISKQDEEACRKALVSLRGVTDVQHEVEEMKKEMNTQEKKVSIIQLFLRPSLRTPLIIGIVMHLSQQLSGVNGVFFYSTSLFQETGLSESAATYTTSAVGGIMVTMTLVSVPLMDKAGRRTLHLVGLGGMFVFGILITLALNLRSEVDDFKYVAVAVILTYVIFFAIGPGSIPWLIVAEMFAHESRPAALSVCTLVNWMASFIVGYTFPFIQEGLGDYTFVPFVVIMALCSVFTYFKVPETKGKTFEEVTSLWRDHEQDGGRRRSYTEMPHRDSNAGARRGNTNKGYASETSRQENL